MLYRVKCFRCNKFLNSEYFSTFEEAFAYAETETNCYGFDCRIDFFDTCISKWYTKCWTQVGECV